MNTCTILSELFKNQQQYVNDFFEKVDIGQAQKILDCFLKCKGMIFFSGVGKSGIIAEKIAMTLVSTGTRALYLSPTNLLHGDIGILSEADLFVLISRSGESEDLLGAIPFIKQRKTKTMAWVSKQGSSLENLCDLSIYLPLSRELCPFDLAPTTSSTIQLIFGDILTVALMKTKEFSLRQYAFNHPAGSIGEQIGIKVADIMIQGDKLPICHLDDCLKDVLVELSNKRLGCVIITDEAFKVHGIFTDGDLRRSLQTKASAVLEEKMKNLMTKDYLSIEKQHLVYEAIKLMQKNPKKWVTMLPVIEEEKLIGMITMHDAISANLL